MAKWMTCFQRVFHVFYTWFSRHYSRGFDVIFNVFSTRFSAGWKLVKASWKLVKTQRDFNVPTIHNSKYSSTWIDCPSFTHYIRLWCLGFIFMLLCQNLFLSHVETTLLSRHEITSDESDEFWPDHHVITTWACYLGALWIKCPAEWS